MKDLDFSDRQKMEKLLEEIYLNHKHHQRIIKTNHQVVIHQFDGAIGDQVTFKGEFFDKGNEKDSWTAVSMRYKNQELAKIETEHGFINPGSLPFWTDQWAFELLSSNQPKPIADTTSIKVISPKWEEIAGVCDTIAAENKEKQLSVLHAPDESATTVLANIRAAIARSKDHAEIAKKLTQLNLPSNIKIKDLAAIVDSVTNQIHSAEQEDRITE